MTIECATPDADLGVALRLTGYLDCQSRALGENGFQALAGGPITAGLISGLTTIFVALIGYRLILGTIPSTRDAVGWALRLGAVLALVTSWPAFQTLVYKVATDGPEQLATVLLPASGLSTDNANSRIQNAYDAIRHGPAAPDDPARDARTTPVYQPTLAGQPGASSTPPAPPPPPPAAQMAAGTLPMPQIASLFVVSTIGMIGALRMAVGFLIAIAPLPILCLLFPATVSMFDGWARALVGAALGVLGASIISMSELLVVEGEVAHAQAVQVGAAAAATLDPQALATIVSLFSIVMLAAVYAAMRAASAFRLPFAGTGHAFGRREDAVRTAALANDVQRPDRGAPGASSAGSETRGRASAVADALTAATLRDQGINSGHSAAEGSSRIMTVRQEGGGITSTPIIPLGVEGRRTTSRKTQSTRRRDMTA